MGDVVLIQYEDKSKPGTFRLGVIIAVEEDRDGLVRTVTVQYSLLADLPVQDRLLYRGVEEEKVEGTSSETSVNIACRGKESEQ